MQKSESQLTRTGTWVPQLFFDLIARLVPGAALLLFFVSIHLGEEGVFRILGVAMVGSAAEHLPVVSLLIAGSVISYVLAMLIWGLWTIVIRVFVHTVPWFRERDYETLLKCDDLAKKYEIIKLHNPVAGARMTKLKAEIHLSSTLLLGVLLGMPVAIFLPREVGNAVQVVSWLVPLVAALGALGALVHFVKRLEEVVENCAELAKPVPLESENAPGAGF